jgi:hypothetical protein
MVRLFLIGLAIPKITLVSPGARIDLEPWSLPASYNVTRDRGIVLTKRVRHPAGTGRLLPGPGPLDWGADHGWRTARDLRRLTDAKPRQFPSLRRGRRREGDGVRTLSGPPLSPIRDALVQGIRMPGRTTEQGT